MTIKRQLLNISQKSIDVRSGAGALEELPRIVSGAVGMPKRALLVSTDDAYAAYGDTVHRALIDAGFSTEECVFPRETDPATLSSATEVLAGCARAALTADDLMLALGDAKLCSSALLAAQLWCGGVPCTLIPTTLDAMVTLPTEMHPLATPEAPDMVSLRPMPTMVVCDFDLIADMPLEARLEGRALMLGAALAEGKRVWEQLAESAPLIAADQPVAFSEVFGSVQQARRNVVKAANPSARHALSYGRATARALARCLGPDAPGWALLSEGMRFEARLAVEAAGLDADIVFDQDDLLEDLGIEEYGFSLDAEDLVRALKEEHARRSNRFLLPLPKSVGTIRLTAVPNDVLMRHARAYVASRAELVA